MDEDMEFRQLMHKLCDGLSAENVLMIRYLCKDVMHFDMKQPYNALNVLEKFEERGLITKTDMTFLAEVLYRISRMDLLKQLPGVKNRKEYESNFLGSTCRNFSAFRLACFHLIDQLTNEDFCHIKVFCKDKLSNRNYSKSNCIISLLISLEEEDHLSEGNLDFLTDCLSNLSNKTPHNMFDRLKHGDEEHIFFPHGPSSGSSRHYLSHSQSLTSSSLSQASNHHLYNSESPHSHSSPSLQHFPYLHSQSMTATSSSSQASSQPQFYGFQSLPAYPFSNTFPKRIHHGPEEGLVESGFATHSKFFLGPPTASAGTATTRTFSEMDTISQKPNSASSFSERSPHLHDYQPYYSTPRYQSRTEPGLQSNGLQAGFLSLNLCSPNVQQNLRFPATKNDLQEHAPIFNVQFTNVQPPPTGLSVCTTANSKFEDKSHELNMQVLSAPVQPMPFTSQVEQVSNDFGPLQNNPRQVFTTTSHVLPHGDVPDDRQRPPQTNIQPRFSLNKGAGSCHIQKSGNNLQSEYIQPQNISVYPSIDLSEEVLDYEQPDDVKKLPQFTNSHSQAAHRTEKTVPSSDSVCSKAITSSQPILCTPSVQAKSLSSTLPITAAAAAPLICAQPNCSSPAEVLECYPMNSAVAGICLIINNCNFKRSRNAGVPGDLILNDRTGSEFDVRAISEVFKLFRFDVRIHIDLDAQTIKDLLNKIAHISHEDYNCFVLVIMSHGGLDRKNGSYIYGADGEKVSYITINKIFKPSLCATLKGKPKIIFYQACQTPCQTLCTPSANSDDLDQDGPDTWNLKKCSENADFLVCYATVPGGIAFRSKTKGSFFISLVAKNLKKFYKTQDLLSIMVRVNNDLVNEDLGQVSMPVSTVRGKIFFRSHQQQEQS